MGPSNSIPRQKLNDWDTGEKSVPVNRTRKRSRVKDGTILERKESPKITTGQNLEGRQ